MNFENRLQTEIGILSSSTLRATGLVKSSISKSNGEENWPDIQSFLVKNFIILVVEFQFEFLAT